MENESNQKDAVQLSARVYYVFATKSTNRSTSRLNVCVSVLVVYARGDVCGDVCGKMRASNDVKSLSFVRALFPQNLDLQYPHPI